MAKHQAHVRDRHLPPTDPARIPRPEPKRFTFRDRVADTLGSIVGLIAAVVLSQVVILSGDGITAMSKSVPWNHESDVSTASIIAPSERSIVLR